MNEETINAIRDALERLERREVDAMVAAYRIDNIISAEDDRYTFQHTEEIDSRVEEVFGS
ncbi:MAG: hypothetical protein IIA10_04380 [Proteobacteria bacterium]|nr:hypothetical protein [Pseudomonadota bacterium]